MKLNMCLVSGLVPVLAFATQVNKYQLRNDSAGEGTAVVTNAAGEKALSPGKFLSADGTTVWWDGSLVPLEGKGFQDVKRFYDRMPARLEKDTSVRRGVWSQCYNSSGECFRFRLKGATKFKVRWSLIYSGLSMGHMPATGVSGLDLYLRNKKTGEWRFFQNARPSKQEGNVAEFWTYGNDAMVYLPLYNGPSKVEFGVPPEATFEPLGPRESGVTKPVVFYGTSITHGGCCSRPGLSFPALVCRRLNAPLVNLGFSGNGRMELSMADYLGEIDASCYVLDCLWNMESVFPTKDDDDLRAAGVSNKVQLVTARFEPFVRRLRQLRPDTPIVLAEQCDVFSSKPSPHDVVIRGVYDKLKAEGWKGLNYVSKEKMYTGDYEGTVDGCHPNDWGMFSLAEAFTPVVREALAWGAIAVKDGDRIAFLGDSITQFGNGNEGGYVNLVMRGLAQCGVKAEKIPAGVSGNKSDQMLARLQRDVLDKKADWMVLSCGVNDVGHGSKGVALEPFKTNVVAIVDRCKAAGVRVILATPTLCTDVDWQTDRNNVKLEGYCDFLRDLAAERNLPLADLNRAERQLLASPACPKAGLTFDHLHVNGYGNAMMARGILAAMGVDADRLDRCEREWRRTVPSMQPFGMHWANWNASDRQITIDVYEAIERKATAAGQSVCEYLMARIPELGRTEADESQKRERQGGDAK